MSNQFLAEEESPNELEYVKLAQLETPRRVFFYKKKDIDGDVIEDSEVFACYEQEAGMYGQFHKLVGVGDGKTYYNYIKNAKVPALCDKCNGAKVIEKAEKDEKGGVVMKKVPCPGCNGFGTIEKALNKNMRIPVSVAREILKGAFDAEWEAADKTKKVKPRYQNRHFDATILMHENSEEIKRSFGGDSQPKPGLF